MIELFQSHDISPLLLPVRKLGIKSRDHFFANNTSAFEELRGHALYEKLNRAHLKQVKLTDEPVKRRDFPIVASSSQACLKHALTANANPAQAKASIAELVNDFYAHSSVAPRDSLWQTWCKMARSWDEDPIPLTRELAIKMGASFKRGKYKSVANYFSRAKSEEADTLGSSWSPALEKLVKKVTRSVLRGLGGCSSKQSFALETLNTLPKSLLAEHDAIGTRNIGANKLRMVILGSWFLLREIELAASESWHLTVDNEKRTCTWMLSATKTDPRAIGTSRSHGCCCKHHRAIICPYHTARDHLKLLVDTLGK